jgi:hypothetical protein
MKTIQSRTAYLTLFILFNLSLAPAMFAQKPEKSKQFNAEMNTIDLGCITKQVAVKAGHKKGLLIKSKKFVFYINRKEKNMLFVSDKLTFSKGDFNII